MKEKFVIRMDKELSNEFDKIVQKRNIKISVAIEEAMKLWIDQENKNNNNQTKEVQKK